MSLLPCIEIETQPPANSSVIWLHGLGASGHDFEPVVEQLNLPEQAAIRFIFPHAPEIPVTVNAGYVMPAWYDILELTEERKINEDQLLESASEVHKLIQREQQRGIPSERILIAGFSQGGAVAYHAALTYPEKLAGILGLSTYFPTANSIQPQMINQSLPIRICHGSLDPMVLETQGRRAYDKLLALGYPVDYKSYEMEHEVILEEIADISTFIQENLL